MKKIKISELPLYSSIKGLFTIGTDSENASVKVSLESEFAKKQDKLSASNPVIRDMIANEAISISKIAGQAVTRAKLAKEVTDELEKKADIYNFSAMTMDAKAAFYQEYVDNDYEIPDKYLDAVCMWWGSVGHFNPEEELQMFIIEPYGSTFRNIVVTFYEDGNVKTDILPFIYPTIITSATSTTAKSIAINGATAAAVANNAARLKTYETTTITDSTGVEVSVTTTVMLSQKCAITPNINDSEVGQAFAIFEGYGRDGSTLIRVKLSTTDKTWNRGNWTIQKVQ